MSHALLQWVHTSRGPNSTVGYRKGIIFRQLDPFILETPCNSNIIKAENELLRIRTRCQVTASVEARVTPRQPFSQHPLLITKYVDLSDGSTRSQIGKSQSRPCYRAAIAVDFVC